MPSVMPFTEHMTESAVNRQLRTGELLKGTYITSDSFSDGFVSIHGSNAKVYMSEADDFNRALHCDVVAIRINNNDPTVGHVDGVLKHTHNQFIGRLKVVQYKQGVTLLAIPNDCHFPPAKVDPEQYPDFQSFIGKELLFNRNEWFASSKYLKVTIAEVLGDVGQVNTEVSIVNHRYKFRLKEVGVDPQLKDFRHLTVFSIDDENVIIRDDCLHSRMLDTGFIEVGVHLADCSYLVEPGSYFDKVASRKEHMRLPISSMLSLDENEDRLTVSTLFILHPATGQIINTYCVRSVIRSTVQLTHAVADKWLTSPLMIFDPVARSIRTLAKIAALNRAKRAATGVLCEDEKFEINSDYFDDTCDFVKPKTFGSSEIVEMLMVLANTWAAQQLLTTFPDTAILCSDPASDDSCYEPLIAAAQTRGITINVIAGRPVWDLSQQSQLNDPVINDILEILSSRCRHRRSFYAIQLDKTMRGLGYRCYTRVTCPIRVYSNLTAQRQLIAACDLSRSFLNELFDPITMGMVCSNANRRDWTSASAGKRISSQQIRYEPAYVSWVCRQFIELYVPKIQLLSKLSLVSDDDSMQPVFFQQTMTVSRDQLTLSFLDQCLVLIKRKTGNSLEIGTISVCLVDPPLLGENDGPCSSSSSSASLPSEPSTSGVQPPSPKKRRLHL